MKCPKCDYVSHDYQDECRKCHFDLLPFKQQVGLFVLRPGVLDLSLVLNSPEGRRLPDDHMLVETEVAGRDEEEDFDSFDIRLDDPMEAPTEHPAAGTAAPVRPLADHLTLELDTRLTNELSSGMFEGLESFQPPEPPAIPAQAAHGNDRAAKPDSLTVELMSQDIPLELTDALQAPAASSEAGTSPARENTLPITDSRTNRTDAFPAELPDDFSNKPTVRLSLDAVDAFPGSTGTHSSPFETPRLPSSDQGAKENTLSVASDTADQSDEFPAELLEELPNEPVDHLPLQEDFAFAADEPTSQLDVSKLQIDMEEESLPTSDAGEDTEELSFTIPTIEIDKADSGTIELGDESFDSLEAFGQEAAEDSRAPLVEESTPQLLNKPPTVRNTSEQFPVPEKTGKMSPASTNVSPRATETAEFHLSQTFEELASIEEESAVDIELEFPSAETLPQSQEKARPASGQVEATPGEIVIDSKEPSQELELADTLSLPEPQMTEIDEDLELELPEVSLEEEIDGLATNLDALDPTATAFESTETTRVGESATETADLRLRQTLQELASSMFDETDLELGPPSATTDWDTPEESPQPLAPSSDSPLPSAMPPVNQFLEFPITPARQREKTGELPFERPSVDQPSIPFDADELADAFKSFESMQLNTPSSDDDNVDTSPIDLDKGEPDFSAFDIPDLVSSDGPQPEYLSLELDTAELTPELLADTFQGTASTGEFEDTGTTSLSLDLPGVPEELSSFDGLDPSFTSLDMPGLVSQEDMALGHLTLELDSSEFTEEPHQETVTPKRITAAFTEEGSSPRQPAPPRSASNPSDELTLDLEDSDLDQESDKF